MEHHYVTDPGVQVFVTISHILMQLGQIRTEAKYLSLAAKNARVTALRAGDVAKGFQAITHFIDEFAHATLTQSVLIDKQSKAIFASALGNVRQMHYQFALRKAKKLAGTRFKQHAVFSQQNQEQMKAFQHQLLILQEQLDSILQQIRAAEYIAITSRTEAVQAGAFAKNLEAVSEHIMQCAKRIRDAISHCHLQLAKFEYRHES